MTTDGELIRQSHTDAAVFAALFDRHGAAIGRFAAQRVGVIAAQDVLSETFLTAFRRRMDFDPAYASAAPWLYGITARVIAKHRREEAQQWRAVVSAAGRDNGAGDGGLGAAEERMDAARRVQGIAARLRGLAARDRDVLLLYAWADLTYEEIAAALDIPVGTVRSRLNRARRKLGEPADRPRPEHRQEESHGTA